MPEQKSSLKAQRRKAVKEYLDILSKLVALYQECWELIVAILNSIKKLTPPQKFALSVLQNSNCDWSVKKRYLLKMIYLFSNRPNCFQLSSLKARREELVQRFKTAFIDLQSVNNQIVELVFQEICQDLRAKLPKTLLKKARLRQGRAFELWNNSIKGMRSSLLLNLRISSATVYLLEAMIENDRKKLLYNAHRLFYGIAIPRGRPQNLLRRSKEGVLLPTRPGQFIRTTLNLNNTYQNVWCEVTRLPKRDGERKYYEVQLPSGELQEILAEEIETSSPKNPLGENLQIWSSHIEDDESYLYQCTRSGIEKEISKISNPQEQIDRLAQIYLENVSDPITVETITDILSDLLEGNSQLIPFVHEQLSEVFSSAL